MITYIVLIIDDVVYNVLIICNILITFCSRSGLSGTPGGTTDECEALVKYYCQRTGNKPAQCHFVHHKPPLPWGWTLDQVTLTARGTTRCINFNYLDPARSVSWLV